VPSVSAVSVVFVDMIAMMYRPEDVPRCCVKA
jgi:hypothetical protein